MVTFEACVINVIVEDVGVKLFLQMTLKGHEVETSLHVLGRIQQNDKPSHMYKKSLVLLNVLYGR